MSNPRLLVLSHGYPPYHGGAELAARYLAREAARGGWAVDVLASDIGGRLPASEELDGVAIRRVRAPKKEWTRHTAAELVFFYLAARRWLDGRDAAWRPDYVLAHFSYPAGLLARRLLARRGTPYAVVLHGSDVPGYQPERFGAVYGLLQPLARRVWRDAERVIAVSEPLRDLARRTWPDGRFSVIGNGVDTEAFQPPAIRLKNGGPLRLVTAAQCIERKGLRYLLEALPGGCELTVCGTGPQEPALRALAAERRLSVRFAGAVEHERMPEVYRGADVFVLPSLQEGLPLALLEAMAAELAIVATPVGGVPRVLRNGENALLVPPADADALRAALEALKDPALRGRLGKAARDSVANRGWPTVWRRYEDLLAGRVQAPSRTNGSRF